jgi:uncharacterized oxidoreductase
MKTTGNTILVTGGGTGIGEALTHRFHDLGNTVIIAGRRMDALKKAIGDRPRMHALTLDIDDAANVAGFAEKLVADFPGMNVLINNASIMRMETALDKRPRSARCGGLHHQQPARSDPGHQRAGRASRQAARCRNRQCQFGAGVRTPGDRPHLFGDQGRHPQLHVSLRAVLKDKIEVIELVPPAVRTDLTPGQKTNERFMPLDRFVDQVMAIFQQTPTPREILVEGVDFMRNAEAENRVDETLASINPFLK